MFECSHIGDIINLKDHYPYYGYDLTLDIADNIADQLLQWKREESNLQRRRRRYHDYYSLDAMKDVENKVVCRLPAPDEVFECKVMHRQLYTALASLPDKQARRIYTHYVLGTSIKEIAMAERVSYSAVRSSILRGLNRIETCLCKENF